MYSENYFFYVFTPVVQEILSVYKNLLFLEQNCIICNNNQLYID